MKSKKTDLKKISFVTLFLIMTLNKVSAQQFYSGDISYHVSKGLDGFVQFFSPIFEMLLGSSNNSEFFFQKVLLLILLIIVCKFILDKVPLFENNKRANILISLIISIISIRFINENDFFSTIFIQYGVLGIAITSILPTVIFFFFIHNTKVGTFGRKVFWAIYGITLTFIWISKSDEIPAMGHQIYILLLICITVFILIDRQIHSYFGLSSFKAFMKEENKEGIYRAQERLKKAKERWESGIMNDYEYKRTVEEEEKRIKEFSKE